MSQMEPYDYAQFPSPYDDDGEDPMQMRSGSSWQPGWRPPSQSPGCGPPWPPGPGSGGWPFWGYWGFRLRSAWRDVKFLNKLIGDIVNELVDTGIVAPGPNFVPGPGSTVPGGGIKGVTDGSDAGPGQVGEFITNVVAVSIPVDWNFSQPINAGILPAGDWDVQATYEPGGGYYGGVSFNLSPIPTGLSSGLTASFGLWVSTSEAGMVNLSLSSQRVRASLSQPTLFAFSLQTNWLAGGGVITPQAGTANFRLSARRMR